MTLGLERYYLVKSEWQTYPATTFLLGLTLTIFLLMQVVYLGQASSGQAILNMGGMYGALVKVMPSQLWRLLTPIFVHIGWQHVLLNSLTLYFLGHLAEDLWGSSRFFLLYLLAGIFGNLLTMVLTPDVLAAGASTSLFGLFGAIVVVGYFGKNPYLKQLGSRYQGLLLVNLLFNLFMPDVSLVGHLGGLFGGAMASVFISLPQPVFNKKSRYLAALLYLTLFVLILGFFYLG